MLFAQIIAFILVLVVFESYQPGKAQLTPWESLAAVLGIMVWLWLGVRFAVSAFLNKTKGKRPPADPPASARKLETWLHLIALLLYMGLVVTGDVKANLIKIDVVASSELASGLAAVGLYFALLLIVWYGVYPLERQVLAQDLDRHGYVAGQARFVAPVIFPWFIVAVVRDLLKTFIPGADAWLQSTPGDLVFLALFLVLISFLFPPMIKAWWGCTPWPKDKTREIAETVLDAAKVKVAAILSWNVMEGKLLTAGILGLFKGYRYLLLTPAIVNALTPMEMAGVVAHEAGHVRHKHIPLYLMFFMGFFLSAYAITEPMGLIMDNIVLSMVREGADPAQSASSISLMAAIPLVVFLVLYLRFVMGFFMRHFERQADFYALGLLGDARPLGDALEKVAELSGNIRDVPSWHHFSIAQRVEALEQAAINPPAALARQAGVIKKGFKVYFAGLLALCVLGFGLQSFDLGMDMRRETVLTLLEKRLAQDPRNAEVRLQVGILNYEMGREKKAVEELTIAVKLAPKNPEVLNGLAWVLVTAKDKSFRDHKKGLKLAQRAVALSPSAHIWDTLAEAYFVNGRPDLALAAAKAALAAKPEQRLDYFKDQVKRFEEAAEDFKKGD